MNAMAAVRVQVRSLLQSSPAFASLPPDKRRDLAKNLVRVASYLVDPDGLISQEFRRPLLQGIVAKKKRRTEVFPLRRIVAYVAAADALVAAVDFPSFVSSLIKGTFQAIVTSSIDQMNAYAKLIANISVTVERFKKDLITDEVARYALIDEFPDLFWRSRGKSKRLRICARAGAPDFGRLSAALGLREPVADPPVAGEVSRLVAAARRRIARNRQSLLATMVLMGTGR